MAKLNKTEIEAVANKTYNELRKVAVKRRQDVMLKYTPSEKCLKTIELATRRDELEKELDQIKDELYEIGKEYEFWLGFKNHSVTEIKDLIINKECKLQKIPSLEEIRDDVVIAAIDKEFNTDKFIENFVKKF